MASKNVRRVGRRLANLGKAITDEVKKALIDGADRIVSEQKALAPRKSGTLLSTIKRSDLKETASQVTVTISAGGDATRKQGNSTKPGGFDYAVEQEFGNQDMAANPFFYPPIRENDPKIRRKVRQAFRKKVRK
ncbi:HK97 gp10 family phage protein [Pararhizobium sp. BT-229]|uniref:HK97-gp10 family putative phage morphogenesis protein n=1 Tax=Pararhizobium sp. BT-229 TaxID=2986923 RepID=UPI0021F7BA04|nr:HK97-gp10 family putative phage morphogenesis protein [Pararhizobium sp. BT-229]MCV9965457.1 HK97 gp10 family phage protein [Pararhizobium sp. BT-229]